MIISLKHVGWVTRRPDLFERFWCDIFGFKKIWESEVTPTMTKILFGLDEGAHCRRYEKDCRGRLL